MPEYTKEDKELALARLRLGDSPAVIARDLGIPEGTVSYWKHELTWEKDDSVDHAREVAKFSKKAWGIIHKGLREIERRIGDAKNPKDIAIAVGVLFDKVIRTVPGKKPGKVRRRADLTGVSTEALRSVVEELQEVAEVTEEKVKEQQ